MGVIMQANFRRQANPTVSVPAPPDGHGDPWWYDRLSMAVPDFAGVGGTTLQLFPCQMTNGGTSADADGYGVHWEYNLGTAAGRTRAGDIDMLRRLCAICYANGVQPIADWVAHQRAGGRAGVYLYDSAGGKGLGRFPKHPGCFRGFTQADFDAGRVPEDPVPDVPDDFAFGDELCPVNATPKGYVQDALIAAGKWLYESLGLCGCRNDDTKGQAIRAVNAWTGTAPMSHHPCIGEYASGNKNDLTWWLHQVNGNNYAYDFEVKYHLQNMCNNGSRWDMRQLQSTGLASLSSYWASRSVPFLENADSDTNGFGSVIFNKLLGYAVMLTSQGWPSIYWRDYSTDKYCYGLKKYIDNLIWIHEHLANGNTIWRHKEYQFVVYERDGAPGLLVGINNDIWGGWKSAYVQTNLGANVHLHDYSGHANDCWTDARGGVTIWIPPNDNGHGYCCFAPAGLNNAPVLGDGTAANLKATDGGYITQMFEGADDLLTGSAMPIGVESGRIWCAPGIVITLNKTTGDGVRFEIVDGAGVKIVNRDWSGVTALRGWHVITAFSNGGKVPYTVNVRYKATKDLLRSECEE